MAVMDNIYIVERIREVWSKLSKDKRHFVDILLHAATRKFLGDTIAKEYVPLLNSKTPTESAKQLPEIHIIVEAVHIMPDSRLGAGLKESRLAIAPYLSEALGSIVERDARALRDYSKAYGELDDSAGAGGIADAGAYAEAYNVWIAKTALYLQECRRTVRAVSYNEFSHLWDKPFGLHYLATHHLLRTQRDCDSRRVFIYDETYWDDTILLKRLFAEVQIQFDAGVNVRVCSMEQLRQIGEGYYYPLLSFGTYDRVAMGVLIPHDTNPVVKLVHDDKQIRDTVTILDDIFDHAEAGRTWSKKHASLMDSAVEEFIKLRVEALRQAVKTRSLD